ncbi:bacterioferritin [Ectothiorhodospiraceae bacterium 2226]|nr:bacterioferritin [Ectothiorhodospiraceae bacterium 2226]
MSGDPRIIGFLTRALSHEFGALQQYLMQAKLTAAWGLGDVSAALRQDVQEETGHAERLMERMLVYGITPNATQLAPVRLGRSLAQLLELNRQLELDAVRLYDEAAAYCARVRAHDDERLFSEILRDELGHVREIEAQMAKLGQGARSGSGG